MKKPIKVATSPLTNTIFAGTLLKDGMWSVGKQDVTLDCLEAVFVHVRAFGKPVTVNDAAGNILYHIIVEEGEIIL